MVYYLDKYKVKVVKSNNFPGKFVASIEEFPSVIILINSKEEALDKLRPIFYQELEKYKQNNKIIPEPGSGKKLLTFAESANVNSLRPFIDEFWEQILNTSYLHSFVSGESRFSAWEHYLTGGKDTLIRKVKEEYGVDIEPIYERPIFEILNFVIINSNKRRNRFR